MKKYVVLSAMVVFFLISGTYVYAQKEKGKKHPNMAAALEFMEKASEKITAAQKANEFDLGGHGKKAKDLLDQASAEIKLAIQSADSGK